MDLKEFATAFGIPGLLIGVWYLLELAKGKRLSADAEREGKLEEKRLDLENRKVDLEFKRVETLATAMTAGFSSLATRIDEHTKIDLSHHATVREEIAELSGRIEGIAFERERTPVETPIPIRPGARVAAGTTYSIPRRAPTRDEEK